MLNAARRIRLTAKGSYALAGNPAVIATRTFTLTADSATALPHRASR